MSQTTASLNYLWACLIAEELARADVTTICLSPGSRCTPLTVAIAKHPKLTSIVHFDERGTAFFGLGVAKARRFPSVLISTSGTAIANFLPAIIEASQDSTPLLILTADRPPELRSTGANQTIDQTKIYGHYVRWTFELPCPTLEIKPEMVLTTLDQAIYRTLRNPSGPVHLNCMFREPFLPDCNIKLHEKTNPSPASFISEAIEIISGDERDSPRHLEELRSAPSVMNGEAKAQKISSIRVDSSSQGISPEYLKEIDDWLQSDCPFNEYPKGTFKVEEPTQKNIASLIDGEDKGILVVGQLNTKDERNSVLALANRLAWPVFADIGSGLKPGLLNDYSIPYF